MSCGRSLTCRNATRDGKAVMDRAKPMNGDQVAVARARSDHAGDGTFCATSSGSRSVIDREHLVHAVVRTWHPGSVE